MALEIERKFRLNELGEDWIKAWMPNTEGYGEYRGSYDIDQGYLYLSEYTTTRVRYQAPTNCRDKAMGFITRKTRMLETTISVQEDEHEIAAEAALIILDTCSHHLRKTRVHHMFNNRLWEIDLFTDVNNIGLNVAEIEFENEEQYHAFDNEPHPPWLGEEVTHDYRYKNSNLILHPYNTW